MNARIQRTREVRLAPPSGLKVATCATLSVLITLLTASAINRATGTEALGPSGSAYAASLTVADAR